MSVIIAITVSVSVAFVAGYIIGSIDATEDMGRRFLKHVDGNMDKLERFMLGEK